MNDYVPCLPKHNTFYKFACFFVGRRKTGMTYKEIYMVVKRLNERKDNKEWGSQYAMFQVLRIYKFLNNNELPKGFSLQ